MDSLKGSIFSGTINTGLIRPLGKGGANALGSLVFSPEEANGLYYSNQVSKNLDEAIKKYYIMNKLPVFKPAKEVPKLADTGE